MTTTINCTTELERAMLLEINESLYQIGKISETQYSFAKQALATA